MHHSNLKRTSVNTGNQWKSEVTGADAHKIPIASATLAYLWSSWPLQPPKVSHRHGQAAVVEKARHILNGLASVAPELGGCVTEDVKASARWNPGVFR